MHERRDCFEESVAPRQALSLLDLRMDDALASRIGRVKSIYVDLDDGRTRWLLVSVGLFGTSHAMVPVLGLAVSGERVWAPYERDNIRSSPNILPGAPLLARQERLVYDHYRLDSERRLKLELLPDGELTLLPTVSADVAPPPRRPHEPAVRIDRVARNTPVGPVRPVLGGPASASR